MAALAAFLWPAMPIFAPPASAQQRSGNQAIDVPYSVAVQEQCAASDGADGDWESDHPAQLSGDAIFLARHVATPNWIRQSVVSIVQQTISETPEALSQRSKSDPNYDERKAISDDVTLALVLEYADRICGLIQTRLANAIDSHVDALKQQEFRSRFEQSDDPELLTTSIISQIGGESFREAVSPVFSVVYWLVSPGVVEELDYRIKAATAHLPDPPPAELETLDAFDVALYGEEVSPSADTNPVVEDYP